MGGTLPAMERLFAQTWQTGQTIGGLYAANTLGAVAGTLVTTFWITPALGFKNTVLILVIVNFLCGVGVLLAAVRSAGLKTSTDSEPERHPDRVRVALALFVTGLLGIGYEILMTRALSQILENTVFSFAAMLTVYLLGTAIGGAIYQLWSPKTSFRTVLHSLLTGLCLTCMTGAGFLLLVETVYTAVRGWAGHGIIGALICEMSAAATVFLLPTILMGMTFSHLAQSACGKNGGLGRALGLNTLGAALAPFVFGVAMLPAFGLKGGLIVLSASYLLLIPLPASRRQWVTALIPAGLCTLFFFLPLPLLFVSVPAGGKVLAYVEGVMAAVSVVRDPSGYVHLKVNNHYQMGGTSSSYSDRRQAHIPLLLHPSPQKALFLGLGTGATFAAAADYAGVEATGVELVPEVVDMLAYFESVTGKLDRQPHLTIKTADARRYLHTSDDSYDVIVADLFHPSRDGAGFLYALEHFQAVKNRLAAGGIFCQWLPLYQLDMEVFKTIARTFCQVFPDATIFLAHYSLNNPIIGLVGGFKALPAETGWFEQHVGNGILRERLNRLQIKNRFDLLGCYLGDAKALAQFNGEGRLNTDNHPLVLYAAPRFVYAEQEPARTRLLSMIDQFNPEAGVALQPLSGQEISDTHARMEKYWSARNMFIHAGVGIPQTQDVQQLLAHVKAPLLAVIRTSPDFDPAYRPLLAMATDLLKVDTVAGSELLQLIMDATPNHPENSILLHILSNRYK